ncbi:MAG TPA: aminoglycoside phosphotransferase [Actinokineospora sp.]|nr:aminoglycoside phosphotransferase [Actinokineospora sp.]
MSTRPQHTVEALADDLRKWLPTQRWFAAKGADVADVRVDRASMLAPGLIHTLIDADGDLYQVLIGIQDEVPDGPVIGRLGESYAFEATQDPELMSVLLELLAKGEAEGGVRWTPEAEIVTGLRARPIGVEQSNTSIVFGYHYILKLFRRPAAAPNRDVELHRALHRVGSAQVADPVGVVETDDLVLGFAQRYLADSAEGWATATASVRDLLAEGDLHAGEVGGDFAGESSRLGAAVAQVHADLAAALGTETVPADRLDRAAEAMHGRLDAVLAAVPALAEHEPMLREAFDAIRALPAGVDVQQIHGDLHLGQVLRTTAGWVLIDFEGEPAAPVEERMTPRSPLRDVAGMLRSFDYAAWQLLGADDDNQRTTRAAEWSDRNRASFCAGYGSVAGADPRDSGVLLRAFELDKAVYEVAYEHRNRPEWVRVPLAALRRA